MTARFGRNKRRAAREAIAAAQRQAANAEALIETRDAQLMAERAKTREAEYLLGEIRERLLRALGSKTAMLPLKLLPKTTSGRPGWARKEPLPVDLDGFIAQSALPDPFSVSTRDDVIDLMRLVAWAERDPREFRKLIRFGDDEAPVGKYSTRAIWVSEHTLRDVGLLGSDRLYFVNQLVGELLDLPPRSKR